MDIRNIDVNEITKTPARDVSVRYFLRPFSPYLHDSSITEIAVNRPGRIYYETKGGWQSEDAPALTFETLVSLGTAVARFAGENVPFSNQDPILSATLPDGERIQIVMPPACRAGHISITIRKPSKQIRTLDAYAAEGFFDRMHPVNRISADDEELLELYKHLHDTTDAAKNRAKFLRRCVELGKNIVIAGETGSGKTTFMKALMQFIPTSERIITIEDVPELLYGLPNHDNQVNLLYPSEASPKSTVTAASLLRSCLRMKPDRILLAELRGGETFDFLNTCLSGHGGSITSCHAGSCRETFEYLALKVLQSEAGGGLSNEVIRKLLNLTIDVVVHVHNDRNYGRHITEIWFDPSVKHQL